MKLVPNWRRVLTRSWSLLLILVAAIFIGLDAAMPFIIGSSDEPNKIFIVLAFVAAVAAIPARLLLQKELHRGDK